MREPFLKYVEEKLGDSFLMISCGLPASWKTETLTEVAMIKGCPMLRTDIIRLEVLKGEDVFDEKVASSMDKRMMVYDETFRRADEALKESNGAIIDATFIKQDLRLRAAGIAARHNRRFIILQTDCPQEVSLARIARRTRENYESNAITEQAYLNNKNKFEAVDLDGIKKSYPGLAVTHLLVDTSQDEPEDWYVTGREDR
jgi:predicted kinase